MIIFLNKCSFQETNCKSGKTSFKRYFCARCLRFRSKNHSSSKYKSFKVFFYLPPTIQNQSMLKLIFLIYENIWEIWVSKDAFSNAVLLTKHFSYSICIFAFHVNSDIVHWYNWEKLFQMRSKSHEDMRHLLFHRI